MLFDRAMELPASERPAYIARCTAGDDAMAIELLDLVQKANGGHGEPAAPADLRPGRADVLGRRPLGERFNLLDAMKRNPAPPAPLPPRPPPLQPPDAHR